MNLRLSSRSSLVQWVAAAGLGLSCFGCSSAEPGTSAAGTAAAPASATEAARVQAYLDSLYTANDVRHSFRSAMGETIDCADFASAPGVKRLLAQGKSMEDILAPIRKAADDRPVGERARNPVYFEGDLDDDGNVRSCPEGTYPHVRITAERIAARGGLDAYLGSHKAPPQRPDVIHPASTVPADGGLQADNGYYAWVQAWMSPTDTLASNQGGTSTMTIATPTLSKYSGDHSVAQVWLTGADHATGLPRQTIEAGWEATSIGVAGPRPPYLFVGTTNNGYAAWCEDDNPSTACPAWVPNPTASLSFGTPLTSSTPGGAQHELTITIQHQYSYLISCIIRRGCTLTKIYHGWGIWASVDGGGADTYLGYYANNGYSDDGNSGLSVGGDSWTVGGEVFDSGKVWGPPPEVTMGEGPLVHGKATYGSSAYHHDFGYYDSTGALQTGGSTIYNTNSEYVYDLATAPGKTSWANYFYYGDYK